MPPVSMHAQRRCQQRGISHARLAAFFDCADIDHRIGGNCRILKVSRRAAESLRGWDGLEKLSAIVSERTGEIVTVLVAFKGKQGRRYRRGG